MGWQHGLKTTLLCTALGCGLACEDTLPNADAGAGPDAGMQTDAGLTDAGQEPPLPTWADCRRGHLAQTMDQDQRRFCEASFSSPATRQRFGLRWIFLGHDDDTVATYPESQMDDLNDIFAASQMEFFIHSRHRINDPIATEGAYGETRFQLSALVPDLRQLLDTDESDPQTVVDLLKSGLEEQGADLDARKRSDPTFRLTAGWRARHLHGAIARLHPDLITIVVRQSQGEKSTGSFPDLDASRPFAGMIYLAQISALSALPHEMGHFFGLPHTHGSWSDQPGATQDWNLSMINGVPDAYWQHLQTLAGNDYSGDFRDTYLPFDASEETLEAFQNGQFLGRKVLGWTTLCYQDDFEPIADDASFVAMIRSEQVPKMKNFIRSTGDDGDFTGNNCRKNFSGEDRSTVFCKYGDGSAHQRLTVADAVVAGTLIFGDAGDEANLMSYISTNTSDGVRRKKHLTTRQRDLIRLSSRVPSRQRLRNYAD